MLKFKLSYLGKLDRSSSKSNAPMPDPVPPPNEL